MADIVMHRIMVEIARSGQLAPVELISLLREIPGYDPKKAPNLEAQVFDSKGFPNGDG